MKKELLFLLLFSVFASAVDIAVCTTFSANTAYNLTSNLTGVPGDCMVVASNTTLECNGFLINGTSTNTGSGVVSAGMSNVTVNNCKINSFSRGIYIRSSSTFVTIANSSIVKSGDFGILVDTSHNSSVYGNTINGSTNSIGIRIILGKDNNITNNALTYNQMGLSVYHVQSTRNLAANDTYSNNTLYDLQVENLGGTAGNTFVNESVDWTKVSLENGTNSTIAYYLRANTTNVAFVGINGASVNVTNSSGGSIPQLQLFTGADGLTAWQQVTFLEGNAVSNVTYSPHNVSANGADFALNSSNVTLNSSQTVGLTLIGLRYVLPSQVSINITSPVIGDFVSHSAFWTVNLNDLDSWIFSSNYSGLWSNSSAVKFTNTNNSWSNFSAVTNTTINGTYGWRFYANNTFGTWNVTNQAFSLQNVSVKSVVLWTPADSSDLTFPVSFKFSVDGNNNSYGCWYLFNGQNTSFANESTNATNYTTQVTANTGFYSLRVFCNNTRGSTTANGFSNLVSFRGIESSSGGGGGGGGSSWFPPTTTPTPAPIFSTAAPPVLRYPIPFETGLPEVDSFVNSTSVWMIGYGLDACQKPQGVSCLDSGADVTNAMVVSVALFLALVAATISFTVYRKRWTQGFAVVSFVLLMMVTGFYVAPLLG